MANKKSEIRIYPSFTEVREDVQATSPFLVYLPQDVYNQIMPGSLSLEGVKVLSMNAILKQNNLEGKTLFVHKEKEIREVKVIRGQDLLVQDQLTKRYYHVGRDQIEFIEVPEETGTEVTFVLEKGGSSVLSYLMYGIKWKPRYTLNIQNDQQDFQGWADIENNTQREYTIDKTELFGGDVNINQPHRYYARNQEVMCMAAMSYDAAPKIESQGEVSGLYMYTIADKYTLAPRSTFSLPFVSPKLTLERVASYTTYFSEGNSKGKFGRIYRISSSDFLPTGSVTVREDGRVVGQAQIPDLTANEKHDLNVGNDPDVSYDRQVKTLLTTKDDAKYEVTVTITNNKNRDVRVEYVENFFQRHEIVTSKPQLTVENENVKHGSNLAAKQNVSLSYVVHLFFNNN